MLEHRHLGEAGFPAVYMSVDPISQRSFSSRCGLTFWITTLSIQGLLAKFSILTLGITALCYYAECHILFIALLNVILPSIIMLSVVMLNVIKLSVVASKKYHIWLENIIFGWKISYLAEKYHIWPKNIIFWLKNIIFGRKISYLAEKYHI